MSGEFSVENTALIYLSTFLICIVIYRISVNSWSKISFDTGSIKRTGYIGILVGIFAICVICFLAGIRGDNVGADTSGYGIEAFTYAQGRSFSRYFQGKTEFSFYGLAYIISKITDNVSIWLGLLEFLTIIPIYYITYKERKNVVPVIALEVFLFKFYNYSLCIMRQSIACSFVLLTAYFFMKKKYWLCAFWGVISLGFHSTAIIGLFAYIIICSLLRTGKGKVFKTVTIIVLFLIIGIAFLPRVVMLIISTGIFPSRFTKFLGFFSEGAASRYGLFECASRLVLLAPLFYILNRKKTEDFFSKYMLTASVVGCCMYILCIITWGINTVYRFTQYFDISFIFSVSYIPNLIKVRIVNKKRGEFFIKFCITLMLVLYWFMVYILFPDGLGFKTEHFSFR